MAIEQENTRRSLKDIDLYELINTANQTRKNSVSTVNKNSQ